MHDFSKIVALRRRRLDRMLKAESAEKAALSEATAALDEAQKEIDDFLEKTRTLEIDLLTELLNKRVSINDLLAVEEELKKVKAKAEELAEHRADCETRLREAKERARIATRNRVQSARKLDKSEHVQDHMLLLQRHASMAREEAAIDEFCELMAARGGEWR